MQKSVLGLFSVSGFVKHPEKTLFMIPSAILSAQTFRPTYSGAKKERYLEILMRFAKP